MPDLPGKEVHLVEREALFQAPVQENFHVLFDGLGLHGLPGVQLLVPHQVAVFAVLVAGGGDVQLKIAVRPETGWGVSPALPPGGKKAFLQYLVKDRHFLSPP